MMTVSKKVFALAALVVATGLVSTAEADPRIMTRDQAYAAARVDTAFDLVAALPPTSDFSLPMAAKGDLLVPANCIGMGNAQAECMDVAYEVESAPSMVVETRVGSTSTLMRMDSMTVAGMPESLPQSE